MARDSKAPNLTLMQVVSFEVKGVTGDWKEVTGRWHELSRQCQGVANLFWSAWTAWHYRKGSYEKLKAWLQRRERQAAPRPKAKRTAIPKAEFEQIVRENRRLKSQVVAAEQALVVAARPEPVSNGKADGPTPSSESATPECDLADGAKASIRRFAAVLVRRVGKHETAEFLRSLANDIDDKK